jgi:hypothetical protein
MVLHFVEPEEAHGHPKAAEPSVGHPGMMAHAPPTQILPGAHGIVDESGTFPVAPQTEAPVAQLVWPVLHTSLLGVQAVPAVQVTQVPLLHTRSAPQVVPLSWFVARSVQLGVPAEQLRLPLWHGEAVGVHAELLAQATQAPALHTWLLPQLDPSLAFPVCVQTDLPVVHDVLPALHVVPVGAQSTFSVHARHAPAEQNRLVPQFVPSFIAVPESVQVGVPAEQSCVPA